MGYYTYHTFEAINGNCFKSDYEKELERITGYTGLFEDDIKWYERKKHMVELSRLHPETIFKINGMGGDREDMWVEYYKNGKMQRCKAKITFDDYDESKLKGLE